MSNTPSKAPVLKIVLFFAAAVLLAVSLIIFFFGFASVGGKMYSLSETELDLSGRNIDNYSVLKRFDDLEYLDLRGTDITLEEYLALKEELADCTILWSVPIGDQLFDSDCEEIKLTSTECITAEQLEALKFMENLTLFDISGSEADLTVISRLSQLTKELPDCTFSWDISIGGQLFAHDVSELVLPAGMTADEYEKLLIFSRLSYIDASAVDDYEKFGVAASQLAEKGTRWTVTLLDGKVNSDAPEIDISGQTVEDLDKFSSVLYALPKLSKLEMCGCGLTNEQMEQLIAEHPSIKFVWTISFARWTDIRTDITCFSSLNHSKQMYTEEELTPLFKYCTDLIALDLGHSSIKDISMITNLTKLQALILGDNEIEDISPLCELKELEYLELWKNDFTDISVLTTLPNLKDINITYCNDIEDFEPLFELQSVEMLWLQNSGFPKELPERLEEKYPDCMFSFYAYESAHGNGWCAQDRYLGIRKAFRNWQYVICYTSWDNVEYQEGVSLLPAIKKWD